MSRLTFGLLPLLALTACATKHEALGNRALAAGDVATAAAEYDRAMADTPMMDFEYERIRKKRQRMMEGEWSPKVDALLATAPTPPTTTYVADLLTLRRDARAAGIPQALATRIDAEVTRVSAPDALGVTDPAAVRAHLAALTALFDTAIAVGAPQDAVDAIVGAYGVTLAAGLPAPGPTDGLARLAELLDLREGVRARRFPAAIDAAIDTELERLADVSFVPATAETSAARFDAALTLRTRARALGAPAAAVALADRAQDDALVHVLARADAESAARRYLPLFDALAPLAARVEPGHPLVARLAAVAREGAAWHTAEAAALPGGYRKLLHLSLAAALSGDRAAAVAERKRLEPAFATSLTLKPAFTADASCAGMETLVAGALPKGARALDMPLALSGCVAREGDTVSYGSHTYVAEEIYYVQEEVQVGTRTETVQVGSHQEQCSKPAGLDGYAWVGLCDVPDYETRTVPVFELRDVEKRRDVQRVLQYPITTRTVQVEAAGSAAVTWEDGTTLRVPFAQRRTESAKGWDYLVPGRTDADAPSRVVQTIPTWHSVAAIRPQVGSAVAAEIATGIAARVRAHRATLARGEGTRALAAGDAAAAGEAFVRSVLHDGKAEGDAAAWIAANTGLSATDAERVLSAEGAPRAPVPGTALPVAAAYTPDALTVGAGAALRVDEVVDAVTTESYQKGILPPNEFVDFHVGLVPTEIQTGPDIGSRVAPVSVGFDMHYNVLEMLLKLRYGLVVHDQLGLRFTLGMTYVEKREYADGESEDGLALTVDPSYALYLGLRTPYVGIFAGGNAGYLHAASGDTVAFGYHVEPSARLTVRAFGTHNVILEGSGFVSVPGVARKDRLLLSFPILGRKGVDLKLSVERTMLPARRLAADGETKEALGTLPVQMVGVQVGARL